MSHPVWPLFDLEIRTPRLTMRYIDDELGVALTEVARHGIHDPSVMPFSTPWSDATSPELERQTLQYYWRTRGQLGPESWTIDMAVLVEGEVVGCAGAIAEHFLTLRSFETGSWLGLDHQGKGLGTEIRIANLHLGFLGFGAEWATTGAYTDNAASLAVTRKLGYEPNGITPHVRRDAPAEIEKYRMPRRHFVERVRRDDVELIGVEGARALLGLSAV